MEHYLSKNKLQIIIFDLDDTLIHEKLNQMGKDILPILQICQRYHKYILLVTYNEDAEHFLKYHNIYDYFDSIFIMEKYHSNKNDAFTQIMIQYNIEPSHLLFIDNCYHHIKEAKKINIPSFQINGNTLLTISSFINILKLYYEEPLEISINYMSNIDYVIDQNDFHSCSANAMVNIFYLCLQQQKNYPLFLCSSLYLYYNTRLLMKTTSTDTGSDYQCMFEAIHQYGMIPERLWSLDKDEHLTSQPPEYCYEFGKNYIWDFHYYKIDKNPLSISNTLVCEFIILATLKRYENQYINDKNFMKTDVNSFLKNYLHSIVIVGIDFTKQYVICLNSYGLYHEGKNGFFYISFKDIPYLLTDEIYAIHTKFTSINFDKHILDTIQYFQNAEIKEIYPIFNDHYRSINVKVHYDHIIVGSGITGSYLAYRLNELYPNQSILLINENSNCNSTVNTIDIENVYIQNTSYRFHLDFNPITYNIAKLCDIDILPFPMDKNENESIIQKLKSNLLSFLQTDTLTPYIQDKTLLYNNPYYCSIYFDTFLNMYQYSTLEKENLLHFIKNDSFLNHIPFPIAFYFLLPIIYKNENWKQLNYNELLIHLKKSFQFSDIQTVLYQKQNRLVLENFYGTIQQNQFMIYKRNKEGYQISDSFLLNYNHLYFCTPIRPECLPLEPYCSFPRSFIRIYLYLQKPFNNKLYVYHPLFGKMISLSESILFLDLRIDSTIHLLLSSKPKYIENGIFYDLYMWPILEKMILSELYEYSPTSFIMFHYDSLLFTTCESFYHKTFLDIINQQLNKKGKIHWINSNLSFMYCYIEGSFELVDYLLKE
jgi:hypothetical protein